TVALQIRDEDLEDVVDGVALQTWPAEGGAVRVRGGEQLGLMACVQLAQELIHAVLAGAGPEGWVRQFGLIYEGVEAESSADLEDARGRGLCVVDAVIDVAEEHAVQVEAFLLEDGDGWFRVDGQVGHDGDSGLDCCAGSGAV